MKDVRTGRVFNGSVHEHFDNIIIGENLKIRKGSDKEGRGQAGFIGREEHEHRRHRRGVERDKGTLKPAFWNKTIDLSMTALEMLRLRFVGRNICPWSSRP